MTFCRLSRLRIAVAVLVSTLAALLRAGEVAIDGIPIEDGIVHQDQCCDLPAGLTARLPEAEAGPLSEFIILPAQRATQPPAVAGEPLDAATRARLRSEIVLQRFIYGRDLGQSIQQPGSGENWRLAEGIGSEFMLLARDMGEAERVTALLGASYGYYMAASDWIGSVALTAPWGDSSAASTEPPGAAGAAPRREASSAGGEITEHDAASRTPLTSLASLLFDVVSHPAFWLPLIGIALLRYGYTGVLYYRRHKRGRRRRFTSLQSPRSSRRSRAPLVASSQNRVRRRRRRRVSLAAP